MPNSTVSSLLDGSNRKLFIRRLEFLQTCHIGRRLFQPAQQNGQPPVDAVYIESCELHDGARNSAEGASTWPSTCRRRANSQQTSAHTRPASQPARTSVG